MKCCGLWSLQLFKLVEVKVQYAMSFWPLMQLAESTSPIEDAPPWWASHFEFDTHQPVAQLFRRFRNHHVEAFVSGTQCDLFTATTFRSPFSLFCSVFLIVVCRLSHASTYPVSCLDLVQKLAPLACQRCSSVLITLFLQLH